MKINPASAYQYYRAYGIGQGAGGDLPAVRQEVAAPTNTDKVSLSGQAVKNGENAKLSQRIAAELSSGTPVARLEELRNAVQNNEYYLPTALLADALLDRQG